MNRAAYWVTVVLLPVAFLALMYLVDREPALDASLLRTHVTGIVSSSESPPSFESSQSQTVELPDWNWRTTTREASHAWYQLKFQAPSEAHDTWAVLMPYVRGNFAVFVNGQRVGESAPMQRPYPEFRVPMYFEFPAPMLRTGENSLEVHAVSERVGSWLSPFYLGPADSLAPSFRYLRFVQVTLVAATVVALGVITVLLLGLFWIRRGDTRHAWFAAATACWTFFNWLSIEPRVLLPNAGLWFALPVLSLGWFTIFSAFFVSRLPGCRRPPRALERGFIAFGFAGSTLLVAMNQSALEVSWAQLYVWVPGLLAISTYIVWQLLRATLREPAFEVRLWLLASVLALVVGVRDYLWDQDLLTGGTFHYLSYTVSLVLIVLALTLLSRISHALTEAEILNRELEQRVAARGVELENNYQRLRELERQRAISAERERMTADMHDGIGGHLVQALAVAENHPGFQQLEPILRGALDDLRLIIDSADPMEGDLLVVLSNFRSRNEARVQASGLRFVWQVTELPALPDFGPHKILQVLRVLQEALTNVLKHARATQVTVRTGTEDVDGRRFILVDVIDDGTGFVAGNVAGRGLGNMRRRAQELGGSVELTAGNGGSILRLTLPVH